MTPLIYAAGLGAGSLHPISVEHDRVLVPERYASVQVDVPAGRIEIVGDGGPRTEITSHSQWSRRPPILNVAVVGTELQVHVVCASALPVCAVDLELHVPGDVSATVRTGAGDLRVAELTGAVDAEARFGSILLEHLAGPVRAETSTGSVVGVDLGSDEVVARTSLGSVDLAFGVAPTRVVADVDAGSVDVTVPTGTYDLRTSAVGQTSISGLTSRPDADQVLDLSTHLGSIHVRGVAVPSDAELAIPVEP